ESVSPRVSARLTDSDGPVSRRRGCLSRRARDRRCHGHRCHRRNRGQSRHGKLVALTILISTFSAANSVVLTAPRVFYAMAKDKLFFAKLAEVHPRFSTPAAAIVALGVWSAVLACAGNFAQLIGGVIFIGWVFYGLGAAAIFPIRKAAAGA